MRKPKLSPKASKPPDPKPERHPSDCSECVHYQPWKYGLVDCAKGFVPHENCKDINIECVNFKSKQSI